MLVYTKRSVSRGSDQFNIIRLKFEDFVVVDVSEDMINTETSTCLK